MASLSNYGTGAAALQIVTPEPLGGAGGQALNDNFKTLYDQYSKRTDVEGERTSVALGSGPGQVIDQVAIGSKRDFAWELLMVNGVNRQRLTVKALTDGSTVDHTEGSIVESGSGHPVLSVVVSGLNLQLLANTAGAGWTAYFRRWTLG